MPDETTRNDLLNQLAAWKDEYSRLGRLIAAAEDFLGESTGLFEGDIESPRPRGARPTIRPDEFVGKSTSEAVRAYLELMGKGNPQGPREMAKALVAGGRDSDEAKAYGNVVSVLKRMKKSGEVQQVRRGQWGLSKWYGGSAQPRRARQNGEDKGDAEP